MKPLVAMFIGYAIVWTGLFVYVVRLHRISRSLAERLRAREGRGA